MEIVVGMHSPFCPYLVDFFACVPPALQNCPTNFFNFYKKLTYYSYILTLYKSHLVFTQYTLLPSVDRCVGVPWICYRYILTSYDQKSAPDIQMHIACKIPFLCLWKVWFLDFHQFLKHLGQIYCFMASRYMFKLWLEKKKLSPWGLGGPRGAIYRCKMGPI